MILLTIAGIKTFCTKITSSIFLPRDWILISKVHTIHHIQNLNMYMIYMYVSYNKLWILDNWNKFKSFIYISLFSYNLISKAISSDCTDFCLQTFVYNCVFWKKEKDTHETFHILKMKTCFEEESHFENESSFRNFTVVCILIFVNFPMFLFVTVAVSSHQWPIKTLEHWKKLNILDMLVDKYFIIFMLVFFTCTWVPHLNEIKIKSLRRKIGFIILIQNVLIPDIMLQHNYIKWCHFFLLLLRNKRFCIFLPKLVWPTVSKKY